MRKFIAIATLALLAAPVAATASQPSDNAAKACKAQRAAIGAAAFNELYGTNRNDRNAFGACVSKHVRAEHANRQNASQECRAERDQLGEAAFNAKYGRNRNDRNAFGACVSQKAREDAQAQQRATVNAARECRRERASMGEAAFRAKYGTNRNRSNAFGKCVSQKAKG